MKVATEISFTVFNSSKNDTKVAPTSGPLLAHLPLLVTTSSLVYINPTIHFQSLSFSLHLFIPPLLSDFTLDFFLPYIVSPLLSSFPFSQLTNHLFTKEEREEVVGEKPLFLFHSLPLPF